MIENEYIKSFLVKKEAYGKFRCNVIIFYVRYTVTIENHTGGRLTPARAWGGNGSTRGVGGVSRERTTVRRAEVSVQQRFTLSGFRRLGVWHCSDVSSGLYPRTRATRGAVNRGTGGNLLLDSTGRICWG